MLEQREPDGFGDSGDQLWVAFALRDQDGVVNVVSVEEKDVAVPTI
jgi:hypothetical protein